MKLLPDMRVRQLNQLPPLDKGGGSLENRAGAGSSSKRDREHERSKLIREILGDEPGESVEAEGGKVDERAISPIGAQGL